MNFSEENVYQTLINSLSAEWRSLFFFSNHNT